jgi:hypothetical protein
MGIPISAQRDADEEAQAHARSIKLTTVVHALAAQVAQLRRQQGERPRPTACGGPPDERMF